MKNKIKTHFHLKKSIIYLRITVNGERTEISTNKKINPSLWNKVSERVQGKNEVNASLNNLIYKVEKIFNNLDLKEERISIRQIINGLKGKDTCTVTLFKAYEYHIENISKLVGTDYTFTTVKRYRSSLNSLKRYCEHIDIRLCDLDYNFIVGYHAFLKNVERLKQNSAAKNIKNLCGVIHTAIKNSWLIQNPFRDFSCNYINPPRSYLTDEEIDSLINKNFSFERLTKVRDVFIFQIYTGLSFIDLYELTENSFQVGVDGNEWIIIERKKTHVRSAIPLLPRARDILVKYNHKLPVYCNQRTNSYLKEIADLCEINKPLTSHIARHTFATTVTLNKGVPIESVSRMLGHTDIRTTQIYAKITDTKVASDMRALL